MVKIRTDEAPADAPATEAPADPDSADASVDLRAPGDTPDAPIQRLRDVVAASVEKSSLRAVAQEIGMTAMGLRGFIRGERTPQERTLRRLRAWYVRNAAMQVGGVDAQDAMAAFAVLMYDLDPKLQEKVTGEVMASLARGYDENGKPRPTWLSGVSGQASRSEMGSQSPVRAPTAITLPDRLASGGTPVSRTGAGGNPRNRLTGGMSRNRVSALGKYAHIPGKSDDFARAKQEEIDHEDGRTS